MSTVIAQHDHQGHVSQPVEHQMCVVKCLKAVQLRVSLVVQEPSSYGNQTPFTSLIVCGKGVLHNPWLRWQPSSCNY
jgi:hypothetical protein